MTALVARLSDSSSWASEPFEVSEPEQLVEGVRRAWDRRILWATDRARSQGAPWALWVPTGVHARLVHGAALSGIAAWLQGKRAARPDAADHVVDAWKRNASDWRWHAARACGATPAGGVELQVQAAGVWISAVPPGRRRVFLGPVASLDVSRDLLASARAYAAHVERLEGLFASVTRAVFYGGPRGVDAEPCS